MLRKGVDADRVAVGVVEEFDLRDGLVREGRGHHVARVTRAASEVHEATLREQNDALTVREDHVIDLRLDLFPAVLLDRRDVDFVVEVADVADDRLILHLHHVVVVDDPHVARRRDEDVRLVGGVVHRHHAVAFHGGLQRADGVDLGDPNLRRQRAQRLRRALADVAVAGDHGDLARDHDVGRALDGVDQRFTAPVKVVELRLRHRIVDVDRGELEVAALRHEFQTVHAGGRLFRDTLDLRQARGVPRGVRREIATDGGVEDALLFRLRIRQHAEILLRARAEVEQQRGVAAVVENHVRVAAVRPLEDAVGVVPVFLEGFTLLREDGDSRGGDRGSGVVLRGEDVARSPAHVRTQRLQRFDEDRRLDGHVQRARNPGALQRLGSGVLVADRHQAGHLRLGDADLFAAPFGLGGIRDAGVDGRGRGGRGHAALRKGPNPAFAGATWAWGSLASDSKTPNVIRSDRRSTSATKAAWRHVIGSARRKSGAFCR